MGLTRGSTARTPDAALCFIAVGLVLLVLWVALVLTLGPFPD
jgi:hypothetical protein